MARKPTVQEIKEYLDGKNYLGLRGADVSVIAERNHLMYRLEKEGTVYALRMINPESHRRHEWISMAEEFAILDAIRSSVLGPKPHVFDREFQEPFMIQEFVTAACFNDLKPLSQEHLTGAARAIALLNSQPVTPMRLPFVEKYTVRSFEKRMRVWQYRLLWACYHSGRADVMKWALKIQPILFKTYLIMTRLEASLPPQDFSFHFDGAHCGNTYWRDGKVVFLDWEKISWRNDPTFTLVRFATSTDSSGSAGQSALDTLVQAYLSVRPIPRFAETARIRFLERQVSDLVWVVWEAIRRKDQRPIEQASSVVRRYSAVRTLLSNY